MASLGLAVLEEPHQPLSFKFPKRQLVSQARPFPRSAERVWLARLSGNMGRRNPFPAASKATGLHSGRFYTTTKAHVGRRAKVT